MVESLWDSELPVQLSFELQYSFDAAATNCWMIGIRTDIRFPMPAALAFLAIGFADGYGQLGKRRLARMHVHVGEINFQNSTRFGLRNKLRNI